MHRHRRGGRGLPRRSTKYLRDLVEDGNVRVTSRDGKDRYGRTVASVSVNGIDIGMKMIRAGLASARYDSRDGYGGHSREGAYHAAQRSGACTSTVEPEQGQTIPPRWTWAALSTAAAGAGVDLSLFGIDTDNNATRAAAAVWIATRADRGVVERAAVRVANERAAAEAAWYAAAAENERIDADRAAAEAAWYAAAEANERAEAERAAAEQAERERAERERTTRSSSSGGGSSGGSSRSRNDNPYDDGGPRRPDGSCPPGGCT